MANLKDIRDRIKSVKSIQKVTKAMKMVAAAKMRRAQENMEKARPYNHRLVEIIQHLLPSVERDMLPLLEVRDVKRVAYVVVTSDRGLAGSFNTSILRKAHNDIDDFGKENVDIFCIGKKANDYFKSRKYNIVGSYFDFWNELNFNQSMKIGIVGLGLIGGSLGLKLQSLNHTIYGIANNEFNEKNFIDYSALIITKTKQQMSWGYLLM